MQDLHRDLAVELVVLDHQQAHAREIRVLDRRLRLRRTAERQTQVNRKFRALPLDAHEVNASVHHLHEPFRDRHAEAGALDPRHRRGLLTAELLIDVFLVLHTHADAGVPDMELVVAIAHRRAARYRPGCPHGHSLSGPFRDATCGALI